MDERVGIEEYVKWRAVLDAINERWVKSMPDWAACELMGYAAVRLCRLEIWAEHVQPEIIKELLPVPLCPIHGVAHDCEETEKFKS